VTTAYLLAKSGREVTLIDADRIGPNSATGYTTAFITSLIDTSVSELIKLFDRKTAKLVYQSQLDAIDFIRKTTAKEKIECEFTDCKAYSYTERSEDLESLKEDHQLLKDLGFSSRFSDKNDLPIPALGYLEVPKQGKFDSLAYIRALAKSAHSAGLTIYENTRAEELQGKGPITVKTNGGEITASDVIVTTYAPFNNPLALRAKKGAYTTYVLEAEIPKGSFPEALYSDTENPYHYFRIDSGKAHDRMILGGEDHRQELHFLRKKSFATLREYAARLLKNIPYKITREWDGQILEPVDGIAFIGEVAPHQYAATGFSGTGMTYGTLAGLIFHDLLLGKANPYAKIFDAKRKPTARQLTGKGKDYLEEFWYGAVVKLFH
jgi:glycine/D-amino acid oxidase-like deaminating enzyme